MFSLKISDVTQSRKSSYFNLIKEQAEQHETNLDDYGTTENTLFGKVGKPDGNNVFLVVDGDTEETLGMATYFKCLGASGAGIYLDDIVTEKHARNRGVGTRTISELARVTLDVSNATHISLECALHNSVAQTFYDTLGAERFSDRHTRRIFGALDRSKDEVFNSGNKINVRNMTVDDADILNGMATPGIVDCVRKGDVLRDKDFVLVVAEDAGGNVLGAGAAYRSFSTFRCVNGIHVSQVMLKDTGATDVATAIVNGFFDAQVSNGWTGHYDLTIKNSDVAFWEPILNNYHIEPLSYGDDPMVVRCITGNPLQMLAEKGRELYIPRNHGTIGVGRHQPRP